MYWIGLVWKKCPVSIIHGVCHKGAQTTDPFSPCCQTRWNMWGQLVEGVPQNVDWASEYIIQDLNIMLVCPKLFFCKHLSLVVDK